MIKYFLFVATLVFVPALLFSQAAITGEDILNRVDANLFSETQKSEVRMVIHGERSQQELSLRVYTAGSEKSFSEFLAPKREEGTKMLKVDDYLWIYSPSTDRTIQISGNLLRQSMMGSDFSYEDMMEDEKLLDVYAVEITGAGELGMEQGEETVSRPVYELELTAKVENVAYARRKLWVDKEYSIPLKEELYAKSGVLLKQLIFKDLIKTDGRWLAKRMRVKDMLKSGQGTELIIDSIEFNPAIPDYMFTKAVLKR